MSKKTPLSALCFLVSSLLATVGLPGGATAQMQEATIDGKNVLLVLSPDLGLEMMELRQYAQELERERVPVDTDFRFEDALDSTGITFRHRIVEDAGKFWKPVHYDHGNGLLLADVDGDQKVDLYFLNQIGANELWRGLGGGRFENVTERAGVGLADRISVTGAFADADNDGDPDLYVTTVRMGNVFFRNEGGGRFVDATAEAGLEHTGHSSGVVFFDYDRDGWLDLFVTNVGVYTGSEQGVGGYYVGFEDAFSGHLFDHRTEYSILYRNRGDGTFEDVTERVGLVEGGWNGDAAFADVNRDGWLDLYVVNMQGDDRYWENREGRSFVDRTEEVFGKTPWGTMGVKFFDWNNDGRLDLYLTDMHSDMQLKVAPGSLEKSKSLMKEFRERGIDNIFGNAFFEAQADGSYREISDRIGAENYWPWGLSTGDLNADGFEDAFLASSMNFPFRYGINSVLLNDEGERFWDAEFLLGVEPRPGNPRTEWFELECSGADRAHPICRGRQGNWTVMGSRGTRTSAIFDLDGDGDLDILTSEFNDVPQVLLSDLTKRRPVNWIGVRLVGSESNRDGLGALVQVTAGGRTFTRLHDGKSGYLSQGVHPLWFGLGEAEEVEKIDIEWPSGRRQTVTSGLETGRTITVEER